MLSELSRLIDDDAELIALALKGLQMTNESIQYHIVNNPRSINQAALFLFKAWRKTQSDNVQAYQNLCQDLEATKIEFYISQALI